MLIGLLADTHDNLPKLDKALSVFAERGVEAILHAGDFVAPFALKLFMQPAIPLVGVFGNNDGERSGLARLCDTLHEPPYRFELAGKVIVLTHSENSLTEDAADGADLLVCGHSHRAGVQKGPPVTINPGEAGGWLTGRCTAAIVETDSMETEIIDLGPQETVSI